MNTTTATPSTVANANESPQKPQQRQTAKDIIAANVKSVKGGVKGDQCGGVKGSHLGL